VVAVMALLQVCRAAALLAAERGIRNSRACFTCEKFAKNKIEKIVFFVCM
jgi:hypothetical protein